MRHEKALSFFTLTIILGMTLAGGTTVSAQTASFLSVKGTWITDATGAPILLRGVNYFGYVGAYPVSLKDSDYATFAQMGFNVIRLQISWSNLEPTKGQFNSGFLWWYLDQDVAYAKKYGLHIVLDMQQDSWAHKFGGDGAPDWAVQQYPASDLGMREAVSDFWANPTMQDHLITVWKNIASYYASEPTIAGYDLLNEPMVYTSINSGLNASNVNSFYARTVAAIRTVDPNHLIFLEPANCMYTLNNPPDSKIVWEPHFYPLSYTTHYYPQNATILQTDFAAKYQKFLLDTKTPMWVGEFGAFMKDNSANNWLAAATTLFDKYQVGWAYFGNLNSIPNCVQKPVTNMDPNQILPILSSIFSIQNSTRNRFEMHTGYMWIT
jgi:aryl-phospho-beta-D-glucosidase BglC (GH1 family)